MIQHGQSCTHQSESVSGQSQEVMGWDGNCALAERASISGHFAALRKGKRWKKRSWGAEVWPQSSVYPG